MNVVVVPGFNVTDPRRSIGRLVPLFETEGVRARVFDYGWLGLLGVRFWNGNAASGLLSLCDALADTGPVYVIGHSNGCAIIQRAAWMVDERGDVTPPFTRCAYISPALNRKAVLAPHIERCDVFYTRSDFAVKVGRLLFWHEWGSMGAFGPESSDRRWRRYDCYPMVQGHSAYFTARGLGLLTQKLVLPVIRHLREGKLQ